jgi:heme-degrading monooxygenase HmoA
MAFVMVSYADSREDYDTVSGHLGMQSDVPAGLVAHAAAEVDGRVQIVDVWESADAMERFQNERLFPAFQASGLMERMMQQSPPVPAEAFDFVRG